MNSGYYKFAIFKEQQKGEISAFLLRVSLWLSVLLYELMFLDIGLFPELCIVSYVVFLYCFFIFFKKGRYLRIKAYSGVFADAILIAGHLFYLQNNYSPDLLISSPLAFAYILLILIGSLHQDDKLLLISVSLNLVLYNSLYLYRFTYFFQNYSEVRFLLPGQIFRSLIFIAVGIYFLFNSRKSARIINGQYDFFSRMEKKNRGIISDIESICAGFGYTKRERDVLQKLLQGKSYKQIAGELFVSPDTVKSHVKSIYRKTNVGSRFELMEALKKAVPGEGDGQTLEIQ